MNFGKKTRESTDNGKRPKTRLTNPHAAPQASSSPVHTGTPAQAMKTVISFLRTLSIEGDDNHALKRALELANFMNAVEQRNATRLRDALEALQAPSHDTTDAAGAHIYLNGVGTADWKRGGDWRRAIQESASELAETLDTIVFVNAEDGRRLGEVT